MNCQPNDWRCPAPFRKAGLLWNSLSAWWLHTKLYSQIEWKQCKHIIKTHTNDVQNIHLTLWSYYGGNEINIQLYSLWKSYFNKCIIYYKQPWKRRGVRKTTSKIIQSLLATAKKKKSCWPANIQKVQTCWLIIFGQTKSERGLGEGSS